MFKKALTLLLATTMVGAFALTGCAKKEEDIKEPVPEENQTTEETTEEASNTEAKIRIASLKGPTTMGMVKLMEDESQDENSNYEFNIVGTADEIVALLAKGEIDAAAIPANLAAVLYNKKGMDVSVAAINTLGVLYIVDSNGAVSTINDLKGKTILATGKGTVPEYTLKYILNANGINPETDVDIQFKSEPAEVLSLLKSKEKSIAMLPQPFVTSALGAVENLNVVLDITEEWEKVSDSGTVVTGVVLVRNEYLKENKATFDKYLEKYDASTKYVNTNVSESASLVEKYGIAPAKIAEKAIPECNITFVEGEEMKKLISGFLEVLYQQNPESIGGKLPDEGFYYSK